MAKATKYGWVFPQKYHKDKNEFKNLDLNDKEIKNEKGLIEVVDGIVENLDKTEKLNQLMTWKEVFRSGEQIRIKEILDEISSEVEHPYGNEFSIDDDTQTRLEKIDDHASEWRIMTAMPESTIDKEKSQKKKQGRPLAGSGEDINDSKSGGNSGSGNQGSTFEPTQGGNNPTTMEGNLKTGK
ncbi:hypothetical protein [Ekhidna sp.]